ncbi:MAG: sensor histidine kinase [Aggregatilineales bacterium]
MQTKQATNITGGTRLWAAGSWIRRQAKRWVAVEHPDPEIVARGQSLAALTLVVMAVLVIILLAMIAYHLPDQTFAIVVALSLIVTLPTYVLARRGRILAAACYFIICFSLVIFLSVLTNTDPNLGASVLLNSMMALNLTPLLAALLIRPRMALIVAACNNVLQVLMYLIWQSLHHPLNGHPYNTITFLVAPIGHQIMIGATCFLLASRLETAARQAKQRTTWLDSILAALPVGVAVYDSEKRKFVFRNTQFETLTGVACAEQPPSVIRHPYELEIRDSAPPLPDNEWPWENSARDGRFGRFYAELCYSDNQTVYLQENTASIPDPMLDKGPYIVYVAADVSQQRQLQRHVERLLSQLRYYHDQANQRVERLQELERMKSSLLSSVSHELRTPLNVILSHADLILNGNSGPISETTAKDVRVIFESAGYLRTIVKTVLDAAQLDARAVVLDVQALDIREPILAALATMRVLAEQRSLTLLEALPQAPVMVMGDPVRLRQIVLNLLSNAVKFTKQGGVSLQLETANGQARVTVEDTGPGIPEKDGELIFEQFIQLRPDNGKKSDGTGLGLSIARSLAALHNGVLWLDKSEMGRGSTFVFIMPLASHPSAGVPASISGLASV